MYSFNTRKANKKQNLLKRVRLTSRNQKFSPIITKVQYTYLNDTKQKQKLNKQKKKKAKVNPILKFEQKTNEWFSIAFVCRHVCNTQKKGEVFVPY